MNPQIQKALDGDIGVHALAPSERAELTRIESKFDAILQAVPVEPLPDLSITILERIRRESRAHDVSVATTTPVRRRTIADWLWQPRTMTVAWRPAYAFTAGVVFLAALAAGSLRHRRDLTSAEPQVFTQFVLRAPNAKGVAVAGDFSGWKPVHAMTQAEAGVWTVVVPLDPGVHDYAFVVDGDRWIPDPSAPPVDDGFGGVNSRLAVLSPDRRS